MSQSHQNGPGTLALSSRSGSTCWWATRLLSKAGRVHSSGIDEQQFLPSWKKNIYIYIYIYTPLYIYKYNMYIMYKSNMHFFRELQTCNLVRTWMRSLSRVWRQSFAMRVGTPQISYAFTAWLLDLLLLISLATVGDDGWPFSDFFKIRASDMTSSRKYIYKYTYIYICINISI